VGTNFKIQAYALILLRGDGFPCVFYGDLYPNQDCFDQATSDKIVQLLIIRKMFAYGPSKDYFLYRNCIGFVRTGDSEHPGCVVVMSNESPGLGPEDDSSPIVRMNVGPGGRGAVFRGFFNTSRRVVMDNKGWGNFSCPRNAVEVWIRDAAVP
jgi:alpha-amylase